MSNQNTKRLQTNISAIPYCNACLSSNRRLSVLGGDLKVYQQICDLPVKVSETVLLCWECLAIVRKIAAFRDKVLTAQMLLTFQGSVLKNGLPTSLSNLSIVETSNNYVIFWQEKDTELEMSNFVVEVKNQNENHESHEAIKKENLCDKNELSNHVTNESEPSICETIELYNKAEIECNDIKNDIESQVRCNDSDLGDFSLELDAGNDKNIKVSISIGNKKDGVEMVTIDKNAIDYKYRSRKRTNRVIRKELSRKVFDKVKIDQNQLDHWINAEKQHYFYKNSKFKCESCIMVWTQKRSSDYHKRRVHNNSSKGYTCDFCKSNIPTKSQLTKHINEHYFGYHCALCTFKCYNYANMKLHLREHKREEHSFNHDFFKHNKNIESRFKCDHCGKHAPTKNKMIEHMKHHMDKFICDICNSTFRSYKCLLVHKKSQHVDAPSESSYCVICDKQFKNVHLYKQHLYSNIAHASERPPKIKEKVPCPKCGKLYGARDAMKNHYNLVHENWSKFRCNSCDKYFLCSSRLLEHKRYYHEKLERPRDKICSICGKGFHTAKILTNHIRTHTGERPYECSDCDAKFAQMVTLKTHVKLIHKKIKRGKPVLDQAVMPK